jgi:hypothetical protein
VVGWTDATYAVSTAACIQAAQGIAQALAMLTGIPFETHWALRTHAIGAGLVLFSAHISQLRGRDRESSHSGPLP